MFKLTTSRIHQASELNARYRQILNEAKSAGVARLRDSDGTAVVILPEREISMMQERQESHEAIADAVRGYLALEPAVLEGRRPEPLELGEWTWLKAFDAEELRELFVELRAAIAESLNGADAAPVLRTLADWRITAEALGDALSRQTLLGQGSASDYVEVDRPSPA